MASAANILGIVCVLFFLSWDTASGVPWDTRFKSITESHSSEFKIDSPFFSEKKTPLRNIQCESGNYRLPDAINPKYYKVELTVDPDAENFKGSVEIELEVVRQTRRIVLHSEVSISNQVGSRPLVTCDGLSVNILDFDQSTNDTHFLTFNLDRNLQAYEHCRLFIHFTGTYGNLEGLYLSSYKNETSEEIIKYATTQFQAVSGRTVFPMFDEPKFKAVFSINLIIPDHLHAISNMNEVPSNGEAPVNFKMVTFKDTPLMSTYLIAFIVSNFDFKSNSIDGPFVYPKEFRIYARPSANDLLDYSLDFGQKSLQKLVEFTGVEYRLPKVDNAAIADFSAGAMENWGLVTYREEYLLHDENTTTARSQLISQIMSHEFAHFFFGNEISPEWWDYTWLSEGFATYFEHLIPDEVSDGKWRLMEQFVANSMQAVMAVDMFGQMNSMTSQVNCPAQVEGNFNMIAYQKAGSVIRMMKHVLGETYFRLGLNSYLSELKTKAATPDLLFEHFQKVLPKENKILPEGKTFKEIFDGWVNQMAYPDVHITKQNDTLITLEQASSDTTDSEWYIPITMVRSGGSHDFSNTSPADWIIPGAKKNVTLAQNDVWYIMNIQHMGYYRVLYDENNWNELIKMLNSTNYHHLHSLNRAQLINDASTFAQTGQLSFNVTFDMMTYLNRERDHIPWISANRAITFLDMLMPRAENYNKYQNFITRLIESNYESFDSKVDDHLAKLHKALKLRIACRYQNSTCRQDAESLFGKYASNQAMQISKDVEYTMYCAAMRNAQVERWNFLFEKYEEEKDSATRLALLNALGCSEQEDIINRYLNMTIENNSSISNEYEKYAAISYVINSGPIGVNVAINFTNKYFEEIRKTIPKYTQMLILTLGGKVVTEDQISWFSIFADQTYFTPEEKIVIDSAVILVNTTRDYLDEILMDIDPWLNANVFSSALINTLSWTLMLVPLIYVYVTNF